MRETGQGKHLIQGKVKLLIAVSLRARAVELGETCQSAGNCGRGLLACAYSVYYKHARVLFIFFLNKLLKIHLRQALAS